jgi:hypothetical protein
LLTVHGSKGLEFEAVHLPSLTVQAFPVGWQGVRCPLPAGLVETEALTMTDELKASHAREEECLFFVALSRARTHLRLTLFRKQSEDRKRGPSPFLDELRGTVEQIARPEQFPLPPNAPRPARVDVRWPQGWNVTDQRLRVYSKCPRRFFYTHVLGLGSARKATAFSRTHDCLYHLIRWLVQARACGNASAEEVQHEFDRIWLERGPVEHAYAEDYHRLATRLVAELVRLGANRRFRAPEAIALNLPSGEIWVEPDEMADLPNGAVLLRRVRTGHKRREEYDELDYTLYQLAGQAKFGNAFQFEAVHLGDELAEPVIISHKKLANRRDTSDKLLGDLRAGWFPPKVDVVSCPRCPHFFVCDATPLGALTPV